MDCCPWHTYPYRWDHYQPCCLFLYFLACGMCCTLSNRLSAFMAMLIYFIHLTSMKEKLDWTEQGFGDLSYKSLNCTITNGNCVQLEYFVSCGKHFNAEVHSYHNIPEEQFHGRKKRKIYKIFIYCCQDSLCLYYKFCVFVCLFIVCVSSLIRQLQSGAQIYSYRNQEN
jgi:hypothetical protein